MFSFTSSEDSLQHEDSIQKDDKNEPGVEGVPFNRGFGSAVNQSGADGAAG